MIPGLVSVVIPAYNSEPYLERTLKTVVAQTYRPIEIIVVVRKSKDRTVEIAKRFTDKVWVYGNERVEQKAFGLAQAQGEFCLNHSSDLLLAPMALEEGVGLLREGWDGVEIDWVPDETIGYWAKVRKLEMMAYIRNQTVFRPNLCRTELLRRAGGYDTRVTVAGDDYQIKLHYDSVGAKVTATKSVMIHTGEPKRLSEWVRKDLYYGRSLPALWDAKGRKGVMTFFPPFGQWWRNRKILFRAGPKMFFSFVFYRLTRYICGMMGMALTRMEQRKAKRMI